MKSLIQIALLVSGIICSSCVAPRNEIVVSVADQRLALYEQEKLKRVYRVSTSKFGLGDEPGSYKTPIGSLEIAEKIGGEAKLGAVFKSRKKTGEILAPNAPGRDPIVTRILWLKGKGPSTSFSYGRYIYIHGTPEERTLGTPTSYGCIRMSSLGIKDLFDQVSVGSPVVITTQSLEHVHRMRQREG